MVGLRGWRLVTIIAQACAYLRSVFGLSPNLVSGNFHNTAIGGINLPIKTGTDPARTIAPCGGTCHNNFTITQKGRTL
tara:strand:- start:510 stop:743 length:234 start_codon:yes stop_codon:yes gene_type:complete